MASTSTLSLDPRTQTLLGHLFDLHAEAEESGHTLVANGLMAMIAGVHLSHSEQRALTLLFHDVAEIARFVPKTVALMPKPDRRNACAER